MFRRLFKRLFLGGRNRPPAHDARSAPAGGSSTGVRLILEDGTSVLPPFDEDLSGRFDYLVANLIAGAPVAEPDPDSARPDPYPTRPDAAPSNEG